MLSQKFFLSFSLSQSSSLRSLKHYFRPPIPSNRREYSRLSRHIPPFVTAFVNFSVEWYLCRHFLAAALLARALFLAIVTYLTLTTGHLRTNYGIFRRYQHFVGHNFLPTYIHLFLLESPYLISAVTETCIKSHIQLFPLMKFDWLFVHPERKLRHLSSASRSLTWGTISWNHHGNV